nr:hypothetical protein Q903MT_gene2500 [Picea sitchensis]
MEGGRNAPALHMLIRNQWCKCTNYPKNFSMHETRCNNLNKEKSPCKPYPIERCVVSHFPELNTLRSARTTGGFWDTYPITMMASGSSVGHHHVFWLDQMTQLLPIKCCCSIST